MAESGEVREDQSRLEQIIEVVSRMPGKAQAEMTASHAEDVLTDAAHANDVGRSGSLDPPMTRRRDGMPSAKG
jgi:hypothetical protein